jgi:kynureninase
MAVMEAALRAFDGVDLNQVRSKSERLTSVFMDVVSDEIEILTPRDPAQRGSQVSIRIDGAEKLIEDLATVGIVGDFRPPDVARFGFAPLYIGFRDVWLAGSAIREWRQQR